MYESRQFRKDREQAKEELYSPSPSCLKCVHYKMCVIARNVTPMMEQMFGMLLEKDRPFKPEDIAKLCQWYDIQDDLEQGS